MFETMLILKGLIIGMIVCIPVGPLGLLSVQRSMSKGQLAGLLSGIGAAVSDSIYCTLAIFGASFINDIVEKYTYFINEVMGILFFVVGLSIILSTKKKNRNIKDREGIEDKKEQLIYTFTSTFMMGLSNPMTFFVFVTVFTKLGIDLQPENIIQNILFILSILLGSCILWIIITTIIKSTKKVLNVKVFIYMDRIIGLIICLFGIFNILKEVIKF